ncbi:MAG TPA: YciI family protein [Candidatus Limnocylindria bacterium]|nr:YciI family protein [Candidatus Limnocylindria bacterium]
MSSTTPASEYIFLFRGVHWDKGLSPEQLQHVMGQLVGWFDALHQQGKVKSGHPLGDESTTVEGRRGRMIADGPFVESKEAVGGYLVVQAKDLEDAVAIARSCPNLDYGTSIEVRPLLEECPVFRRAKEILASAA